MFFLSFEYYIAALTAQQLNGDGFYQCFAIKINQIIIFLHGNICRNQVARRGMPSWETDHLRGRARWVLNLILAIFDLFSLFSQKVPFSNSFITSSTNAFSPQVTFDTSWAKNEKTDEKWHYRASLCAQNTQNNQTRALLKNKNCGIHIF